MEIERDMEKGMEMENNADNFPEKHLQYPRWQEPLHLALLEFDKDKLKELVANAEAAIFARLQELSQTENNTAERQAVRDGLASLRVLKRDVLGYPDWDK